MDQFFWRPSTSWKPVLGWKMPRTNVFPRGVQLHLPKPPGTPIVDDNMRMVTAPPKGGGHVPEIRTRSTSGLPVDVQPPKAIFQGDSMEEMRFSAGLASQEAFLPISLAPEALSDVNSDISGQFLGSTPRGGGDNVQGRCSPDFCDPSGSIGKYFGTSEFHGPEWSRAAGKFL